MALSILSLSVKSAVSINLLPPSTISFLSSSFNSNNSPVVFITLKNSFCSCLGLLFVKSFKNPSSFSVIPPIVFNSFWIFNFNSFSLELSLGSHILVVSPILVSHAFAYSSKDKPFLYPLIFTPSYKA